MNISNKKTCRSLIRIDNVSDDLKSIDITIPSWNANRIVRLSTSDLPVEYIPRLNAGTLFFAHVNIDADSSDDLNIHSYEPIKKIRMKYETFINIHKQDVQIKKEIRRLIELCEDDDAIISEDSLDLMLFFLSKITNYTLPVITVDDNGLFCLDWEDSALQSITLRFLDDDNLDYAIFLQSSTVGKINIFSGQDSIVNFLDVFYGKNHLIKQVIQQDIKNI
jgi:hypothetical protein